MYHLGIVQVPLIEWLKFKHLFDYKNVKMKLCLYKIYIFSKLFDLYTKIANISKVILS